MNKLARLVAPLVVAAALLVPSAGSSAPSVRFVPIATKAPAWYTSELHARVMAAGVRGLRLPDSISIPMSSVAFLGIRPGQLIIVSNPGGFSLCTSNFVFHNGSNYAIGTAGHCGNVGGQVSMLFAPRILANIGSITKSVNGGPGNDFALISIKPELNGQVSPSMAYWGGPTEVFPGGSVPTIVRYAGWGLVIGTGGTPRAGVGVSYSTAGEWRFEGPIIFGDSGSGAISGNGAAVGNITHLVVVDSSRFPVTWEAGTSIQRILQIAGLPLATCGKIPWPLYGCPHL